MALLSTAKKVATGLLDMDKPSRMARAKEQGFDTDAGYKNTIIDSQTKYECGYNNIKNIKF